MSVNNFDPYFVLVEPIYRGNVGAVARVLNNFGYTNLRIIGTVPTKGDHYLAVHSEEVMKNIKCFDSLEIALEDMDNIIAVSRRKGRKKKVDISAKNIETFMTDLPRGKTAFVFGRETYGLTDEEADLCPVRCIIPTDNRFTSLNLAQAVAIISYELHNGKIKLTEKAPITLASKHSIKNACSNIIKYLQDLEYFRNGDEIKTQKQLENIFFKSYTSDDNLYFLTKLFHRLTILDKNNCSVK